MTNLIIHIGPPKCGSTSIQHFFATQEKPCVQSTRFTLLDPMAVSQLNCEEPDSALLSVFSKLLSDNLAGSDILILSHEHLSQCPHAIRNICDLAQDRVTKIAIVGYARRQSDFLMSLYAQWGFRSRGLIEAMPVVLNGLEVEPLLFSGLEQYLISLIANDFDPPDDRIYDWHNSYTNISQLVSKSGAVIKCGVLPEKGSGRSLLQDFCDKSGLTLREELQAESQQIFNVSFNQDIVEAITNAVAFGLEMPGPDDANEIFDLLTAKMVQTPPDQSGLLPALKSYIDSYFLASNQLFCQEYGLAEAAYFAPSTHFDKTGILNIIKQEGQNRASNKSLVIGNYRMLSARMIELCLKLARENAAMLHPGPASLDTKPTSSRLVEEIRRLFKH